MVPVMIKGGGKGGKGGKAEDPRHRKAMDKLAQIPAERKVWVGGLKKEVNAGMLRRHFKDMDCPPHHFELMSRGTAVLAFKTPEEAESAIAVVNGSDLDGKAIEVDVWTTKEKTDGDKPKVKKHNLKRSGGGSIEAKQKKNETKLARKIEKMDSDVKVKVTGFKADTTWAPIKKLFTEAGLDVGLCTILKPGVAAVAFKSADDVSTAIDSLNGADLDGKTVTVKAWS